MLLCGLFVLRSKSRIFAEGDQLMSIFIPIDPVRNHCHSRSLHMYEGASMWGPIASQPVVSITPST
jgi:hypothetical protein